MRKTFCDRCGEQCVNTIAHIHGMIEHATSTGEQVGYDEIKGIDLCPECYGLAKRLLNLTETPQQMYGPDGPDSMAVMAVPPPVLTDIP